MQTLAGMERLRRFADGVGIEVEFVSLLDCADSETLSAVQSSPVLRDHDQIIEISNRDLGMSRNNGIQAARGRFIGIFDGDDYYSDNWLVEALKVAMASTSNLIVHPELQISFGASNCVAHLLDMDKCPNYPLQNCLVIHPWIACSFGLKQIYEDTPYCRSDTAQTGFGFEDWQWNLETISKGARHVSALKTAHYYRRKVSSMLTGMVASGALIRPTAFFDHPERWNIRLRSHASPALTQVPDAQEQVMPQWAVQGFRNLAEIEPSLNPTTEFLDKFFVYLHPFDLAPGELYQKAVSFIGAYEPDVICLLPWLCWGAADDAAWQRLFSEHSAGKKVLVISSSCDDSTLNKDVPESYRLLEFGALSQSFSESNRIVVLARLILQSTASEIHVINSPVGWEVVKRHGKSFIATGKKIYASVHSVDSDSSEAVEFHTREITQCLQESDAGSEAAKLQIEAWETLALKYAVAQEQEQEQEHEHEQNQPDEALTVDQPIIGNKNSRIAARAKRLLSRVLGKQG